MNLHAAMGHSMGVLRFLICIAVLLTFAAQQSEIEFWRKFLASGFPPEQESLELFNGAGEQ